MKCTVCGNKVNKLEYGKLRLQEVSVINILNEKVKTKKPLLNLTLCEKCQFEINTELVNMVLKKPEVRVPIKSEPEIQDHDINAIRYAMTKDLAEQLVGNPECDQDCANCDGARI